LRKKHHYNLFTIISPLIIFCLCLGASISANQSQNERLYPETKSTTGKSLSNSAYQAEKNNQPPSSLLVMDPIDSIKKNFSQDENLPMDISKLLPGPTPLPTPTVLGQAVTTTFVLAVWVKLICDMLIK
jgi:hypothetical protein